MLEGLPPISRRSRSGAKPSAGAKREKLTAKAQGAGQGRARPCEEGGPWAEAEALEERSRAEDDLWER